MQALAYTTASAGRGALLTVAYSLGLGLPFVLAAVGFRRALGAFAWVRRHHLWVMRAGGAMLIVLGLLLVTGLWTDLSIQLRVWTSTFTPAERTMLLDLAREWVDILGSDAAAAKMKEIEGNIASTYFAWAGPTTNGKGAYFRIQGPTVFIEYAPQGSGDANVDHIHTIYRDPANDYADKATR